MKVIIIEDEINAAKRLQRLLKEVDADVKFVGMADSIESSIQILESDLEYDIVFMDIHLADGSSFAIFDTVTIVKPLIFITAYDEYAINAFKVNAIDYILKPVKKAELEQAYLKGSQTQKSTGIDYKKLAEVLQNSEHERRFVIRVGQQIKVVELKEVAYFYTQDKITFLITNSGKRYAIDYSLEKLEEILNPYLFFRINRQFIVGLNAIKEMHAYSKSRVKIDLSPPCKIDTISSTERSPHFKKWLIGGN